MMWSASFGTTPEGDYPTEEEYRSGRVSDHKDYSDDYRQYYRDLLEEAFKADPRFEKGQVLWVKLI